ncbi:MAG TPA: hypothetical protein VLK25_02840 [Allosphingosinicella sp.]|nr:hypothetical protein [Allosphingosinicella sp.]
MVKPVTGRKMQDGLLGRPALALLIAMALAQPAFGQRSAQAPAGQRAPAAAAPNLPVPDQRTALKMLWGIMAAVDQANRTGNYSVLRDLGTPAFQANNNPANLAGIFTGLREQQVDLSDALIVTPVWEISPRMVSPTTLRMRGSFPLRPQAIAFDLLFTWSDGWRLDGIAVQAMPTAR